MEKTKSIVRRELRAYLCSFLDRRIKQTLHLWWRCILTITSQACRSMLQQQTAPWILSLPFRSSVCIMIMLVRRAADDRLARTMQGGASLAKLMPEVRYRAMSRAI